MGGDLNDSFELPDTESTAALNLLVNAGIDEGSLGGGASIVDRFGGTSEPSATGSGGVGEPPAAHPGDEGEERQERDGEEEGRRHPREPRPRQPRGRRP